MLLYQAPAEFAEELAQELAFSGTPVLRREGNLFFAADDSGPMAWSEWTWKHADSFNFDSIGQAAKFLRSLDRNWVNASLVEHRRAALVAEQLGRPKDGLLRFGESLPVLKYSAFALLSRTELVYAREYGPLMPLGQYKFAEDKSAPSRAYLKLWEAITRAGHMPVPEERCLDLGSSPGGWTWVLAKLGCHVISVDRAPLAPSMGSFKNIDFKKGDAFAQTPELVGDLDWLVSDIICFPEKLYEFAADWKASGRCRNFICTIKFKGAADPVWIEKFRGLGGDVVHLFNNKHELTWIDLAP